MKKGKVQGRHGSFRSGLSRRDFLRATTGTTVSAVLATGRNPAATASAVPAESPSVKGASPQVKNYDVVVVSATTGGFGAALAAGRQGMKVALIEETPALGGMVTNGVSDTNLLSPGASSGIFEEFRLRCQKYYEQNFPDDPVMKKFQNARLGFRSEPHVADMLFKQMLAEVAGIEVFYKRYVVKVLKAGNRVTGIVTRDVNEADEITFLAPVTV